MLTAKGYMGSPMLLVCVGLNPFAFLVFVVFLYIPSTLLVKKDTVVSKTDLSSRALTFQWRMKIREIDCIRKHETVLSASNKENKNKRHLLREGAVMGKQSGKFFIKVVFS